MTTTAIPVTCDVDAKARLDELGLHDACEKMIEHILESVPNLVRLDVTCPYNEVLGPDQQIVFQAYISGPPTIEHDLSFDRWVIESFPGEAGFSFVLLTVFGQPNGR